MHCNAIGQPVVVPPVLSSDRKMIGCRPADVLLEASVESVRHVDRLLEYLVLPQLQDEMSTADMHLMCMH